MRVGQTGRRKSSKQAASQATSKRSRLLLAGLRTPAAAAVPRRRLPLHNQAPGARLDDHAALGVEPRGVALQRGGRARQVARRNALHAVDHCAAGGRGRAAVGGVRATIFRGDRCSRCSRRVHRWRHSSWAHQHTLAARAPALSMA